MTTERHPRSILRALLRVVLSALAVVVLCVLMLAGWWEWADWETHRRMAALEAKWAASLKEIPIGADESVAKVWIRRRAPADERGKAERGPDEFSHAYVVFLGSVDVVGPRFPCAAWMLDAEIGIGADHRVTSRRTNWGGVCV